MAMHARSVAAYLKGLKSPEKSAIRRILAASLGGDGSARRFPQCNAQVRERLHDAVFEVENDRESRGSGRPYAEDVARLRDLRNRLMDDLGWNDA